MTGVVVSLFNLPTKSNPANEKIVQIGLAEIERLVRKMGKEDGMGSFEEGFKQFVISTLGKTPAE